MSTCDKCGEEIEFRYVGGVVRPIHVHGGWCSAETSSNGYYSNPTRPPAKYRISQYTSEDMCRRTLCPMCGQSVFFVRHNGGSVWFDELGYPWPKHACFNNDLPLGFRKMQDTKQISTQTRFGLILRIRPTTFEYTMLAIVLENKTGKCLAVEGDAEHLLGALVAMQPDQVVDANGREFYIKFPNMDHVKGFDLPSDWLKNPT